MREELDVVVQGRDWGLGSLQVDQHSAPLRAFAVTPFAIELITPRRDFGKNARTDVLAHDAPVDPPGAGVVAAAAGARFPAHGVV